MPTRNYKPIAIFYEHPDWFRPLFAELERREIPFVQLDANAHSFDPSEEESPYSLVFNRDLKRVSARYSRGAEPSVSGESRHQQCETGTARCDRLAIPRCSEGQH